MTPPRVLFRILLVVFFVESVVMVFVMTVIPREWPAVRVVLDATLMTALSAPLIYLTIARPLRRQAFAEQAKAESIAGAAAEGILTLDERGRVETFNRAAEAIFRYGAVEIIGQDVAVLMPETFRRPYAVGVPHYVPIHDLRLIGRTSEVNGRRKDGSQVPLALSLTALRVSGRWLFTAMVRDLTAIKRAETERQVRAFQQAVVVRQGQRALACDDLSQLLQETVQGVAETLHVPNCLLLELQADGETLLPRAGVGWAQSLLEEAAWNIHHDSPQAGNLLSEEPVLVETYCLDSRYDGPELLLYHGIVSSLTVLIRHHGRPFGVLGVYADTLRKFVTDEVHFLEDISIVVSLAVQRKEAELKQRERETLRAKHLATVAQMATGVAHELRNPLTAIKLLIQAGREPDGGGVVQGEDLEYIEQEIRRMESCLRSYLEFARPRKPERRALDLADLIDRTLVLIEPRATQQRVALQFDRPPQPVVVDADWEQVQQILINLAFNALDAVASEGTIEIRLRATAERTAVGSAELQVRDSGPGIAPEVLAQLFQPFVTSKETGTGLGLVISRRIAEEHGGTLTARNRTSGGACFELRLPLRA